MLILTKLCVNTDQEFEESHEKFPSQNTVTKSDTLQFDEVSAQCNEEDNNIEDDNDNPVCQQVASPCTGGTTTASRVSLIKQLNQPKEQYDYGDNFSKVIGGRLRKFQFGRYY
jgi:hypothetical protein